MRRPLPPSPADLTAVSQHAVDAVAERWARRYNVLPLSLTEREIVVATADPADLECERALAFATGRDVVMRAAPADAIARRVDEVYRAEPREQVVARHVDLHVIGRDASHTAEDPAEHGLSVVALVDQLLAEGIAARASDVHIEPEEHAIAVRHRIDGVLRPARQLPRSVLAALVSRVKIISGLDIADRLRPQDGRARVALNGLPIDLRVSTLPASHGEKVVIRILDAGATTLSLESIGFDPAELVRIERLLEQREGLILVTGPTGSGKTTTLYAALRRLGQRAVNIVTVEDPIEYRLPGIVQVQVNERAGLTFATALRSIMRQDPDVLLVGEIRDRETAEIAIQASLTGHLVLSTLHTNDAASAVTRLIDIGVASYKLATAIKGVMAQRLVRRVCESCRGADAARCRACGGTGFRGRVPIAEIILGTPAFEARVAAGDTAERLAAAAREGGMRTIWESGMAQVAAGATTIDEVTRVAAPDGTPLPAAEGETPVAYLGRMTASRVGTVDVQVIRALPEGWQVLVLRRASSTRCPGAWESVHGRMEPGERPDEAALRELREETGLEAERLYSITVQPFYIVAAGVVDLAVVFAALVAPDATVTLGEEHDSFEWLSPDEAAARYQWPRETAALREAQQLLRGGDAGPAEDVLRVR